MSQIQSFPLSPGCGKQDITRAILLFYMGMKGLLWFNISFFFLFCFVFVCRNEAGLSLLFSEADNKDAKVDRELPQGTLQDLVRGMAIFINKTGIDKNKLNELQGFVQCYKLAQQIHLLHLELEVAATAAVASSSFLRASLCLVVITIPWCSTQR